MAPTLLDLPVEIFDAIIDQLPRDYALAGHEFRIFIKDLKSLRQTFREAESKTRRRFAKDIFATVSMDVLKIDSRNRADAILSNETFRECVRSLHPCFGGCKARLESAIGWSTDAAGRNPGRLHPQFKAILGKARGLEVLDLQSPGVQPGAPAEVRNMIEHVWYQVFTATLTIIAAHDVSHLRTLYLGSHFLNFLPIIPSLWQGIAKGSTGFRNLEGLMVYNFVEGDVIPLTSSAQSADPTKSQNLADLVAMAPKLRELTVGGTSLTVDNCSRWIHDVQKVPSGPPALSRLTLKEIELTEVQLRRFLLCFGSTLRFLWLSYVRLTSGSWRTPFRELRNKLNVQDLKIYRLSEYDHWISLANVIKEMPLVIDQ